MIFGARAEVGDTIEETRANMFGVLYALHEEHVRAHGAPPPSLDVSEEALELLGVSEYRGVPLNLDARREGLSAAHAVSFPRAWPPRWERV